MAFEYLESSNLIISGTKRAFEVNKQHFSLFQKCSLLDVKKQTSKHVADTTFNISDSVNYKYALFLRKSLRRENVVIFNNMFTPIDLNHNHNTCTAINHLLDITQKQTCRYGTYSMVFTASKV